MNTLRDFITCYNAEDRHVRDATDRFKFYSQDDEVVLIGSRPARRRPLGPGGQHLTPLRRYRDHVLPLR